MRRGFHYFLCLFSGFSFVILSVLAIGSVDGRSVTRIEARGTVCPENQIFLTLLPHESDCTQFYYCQKGITNLMKCAAGTEFDSVNKVKLLQLCCVQSTFLYKI